MGDQVKVRQVLSSVVANTIKHTGKGFISTEAQLVDKSEEEVAVESAVADTGSRIGPRKLDTVFQNFEQSISLHLDNL